MLYPTRWLIILLILPGICFGIGIKESPFLSLGFILMGVLLALALLDLLLSPSVKKLDGLRINSEVLSLGATNTIRLKIYNGNKQNIYIEVTDQYPDEGNVQDIPEKLMISPITSEQLIYKFTPITRGKHQFGKIIVHLRTHLRLWYKLGYLGKEEYIKVYPDIQAVKKYQLLLKKNMLSEMGVQQTRFLGQGSEFDRLREYQRDDDYRFIDWKATARSRKLISRQYQVEQSQDIIFLLDAGRVMLTEHQGISFFDYSLNSILMLSYVIVNQGDNIGAMCFDDNIHFYLPPARGAMAIQRFISNVYHIYPSYNTSNYEKAFNWIAKYHRKRSLVILFTNVLDDSSKNTIISFTSILKKHHLPLCVLIKDDYLVQQAHSFANTEEEVYKKAVASDLLLWRNKIMQDLNTQQVLSLDVLPQEISPKLISTYLQIKGNRRL